MNDTDTEKRPSSLRAETLVQLDNELARARRQFPGTEGAFAALLEEIGELANALLEERSSEHIRSEAIQVACVAVRMTEEGDESYPHSMKSAPKRVGGCEPLTRSALLAQSHLGRGAAPRPDFLACIAGDAGMLAVHLMTGDNRHAELAARHVAVGALRFVEEGDARWPCYVPHVYGEYKNA